MGLIETIFKLCEILKMMMELIKKQAEIIEQNHLVDTEENAEYHRLQREINMELQSAGLKAWRDELES